MDVALAASLHPRSDRWTIDAELRDLGLPPDEVDAVVTADPVIVHRYLELHRERLQERLADQLRTLERLERLLTPDDGGGQPGGLT